MHNAVHRRDVVFGMLKFRRVRVDHDEAQFDTSSKLFVSAGFHCLEHYLMFHGFRILGAPFRILVAFLKEENLSDNVSEVSNNTVM